MIVSIFRCVVHSCEKETVMIGKMKFLGFVAFIIILHVHLSLATSEFSRGREILLNKGLQIEGFVYPTLEDTWDEVGLNISQLQNAHFTAVNFVWNNKVENYLGSPPGEMLWSRHFYRTEQTLRQSEQAYLPNLVSLQYRDEQSITHPQNLIDAKNWLAGMRTACPNTISYLNQAATAASEQQLRYFVRYAQPDMIMFDLYPFSGDVSWDPYKNGSLTCYSHFLERLQVYRTVGLEGIDGTGAKPIPYAVYLQAKRTGTLEHRASESEIRLNQFIPWAFGYTFVTAYLYMSPTAYDPCYSDMFTSVGDTDPTATFDYFTETNRQSCNLGPALVRLKSTDIRIILGQGNVKPYNVSLWTAASTEEPYITSIVNNDSVDVIVGYFKPLSESFDGATYSDQIYFMIVNGFSAPNMSAYTARKQFTINFDFQSSGITSLQRLNRDTGQVETVALIHDGGSLYHLNLTLYGGTGDLFKFNTGAPFVGF